MKIAVTSQNRKSITEHAGRCRKFWVYVVENNKIVGKELLELPKDQAFHESVSHQSHPLDDIDILITAGLGQGLMMRLAQKGIKGLVTKESDPEEAVLLYLNGSLEVGLPNEHHHKHI